MTAIVKARYESGVLRPLEPLGLEEGQKVTVSVAQVPQSDQGQADGPMLRILRKVRARQMQLPPGTWDVMPADLAENKKHYLYGRPRGEG